MNKIGFDNEKYLAMQSEHIRERINEFGGKLYLELAITKLLLFELMATFYFLS